MAHLIHPSLHKENTHMNAISMQRAARLLPPSVLLLLARTAAATTFWRAGRAKVDGLFTIKDATYQLFEYEYQLPLLPPETAAQLATVSEHLFPLLLLLGLSTRLSALALLGMTAVIQVFVYPAAWPTHLGWAALLLALVARGGGAISLDHAFARAPAPANERRSAR
ncbi:DoxX family membrane protein [Massilia sp. ML15P13]|uniref:DoxX family membrane protein n=2 Tax=Telluria aromaticivorans TaxID=2725995 RepID=A0A7Y2K0T6_9BURK|nr:DoxX family membrane protein [Telluria aromaticivorans]